MFSTQVCTLSFKTITNWPGVYVDDSPLQAEGRIIDADKLRFERGNPRTFKGWEKLSATMLNGVTRALHSWMDFSGVKYLAAGTNSNTYALTDSLPHDITPIISWGGQASISFTTTLGSAVVTAAWTSHGLAQGQAFRLFNSQTASVGGVTINTAAATTSAPSPWYVVASVPDANTITYTAAQTATSAAGPTAVTVDYQQFLAPGLQDAIGALGYGVGTYSTGTYSSPASSNTFAMTHSLANYGQNLLLCPRGGRLYEWAPATSNSELTTNGTFTGSATGWTLGTNWAYGTNNAVATSSSSTVTQVITTPNNAFCLLAFDITGFSGGSIQPSYDSASIGGVVTANGRYYRSFFSVGSSATLAFTGAAFSGNLTNISVKQLLSAEVVPNAPTQNICMGVSAEGHVFLGGTVEAISGKFNPLHVRWSDPSSKPVGEQSWISGPTSLAGSDTVAVGSRIVAQRPGNGEHLVWTDRALYAFTYTGNSNLTYRMRQVGTNCGLIGANAVTMLGGIAFWMAPGGGYFAYSAGGSPQPIRSPMQKDVFDHIANGQEDKIFAGTIAQHQDVIFLYPDSRDGTECSRYTLWCTQEVPQPEENINPGGPVGVFANGTFDRTAWLDASSATPYPAAASSGGYLYYQEKGNSADGGPIYWKMRFGAVQIGNGDTLYMVRSLLPDFASLMGGCTVTAYAYKYPQSTPVVTGPFSLTSATEKLDMLNDAPVGRQISLLFEGNAAPAYMAAGRMQLDIQDTGMNF